MVIQSIFWKSFHNFKIKLWGGPQEADLDKNRTNVVNKQFKVLKQKYFLRIIYWVEICILGDGAVGKTSICHRFINDEFGNSYKPTIGLDFYIKRLMIPTHDGKLKWYEVKESTNREYAVNFRFLRNLIWQIWSLWIMKLKFYYKHDFSYRKLAADAWQIDLFISYMDHWQEK